MPHTRHTFFAWKHNCHVLISPGIGNERNPYRLQNGLVSSNLMRRILTIIRNYFTECAAQDPNHTYLQVLQPDLVLGAYARFREGTLRSVIAIATE